MSIRAVLVVTYGRTDPSSSNVDNHFERECRDHVLGSERRIIEYEAHAAANIEAKKPKLNSSSEKRKELNSDTKTETKLPRLSVKAPKNPSKAAKCYTRGRAEDVHGELSLPTEAAP